MNFRLGRCEPNAPGGCSNSMFVSYAQNLEDVVLWRALRHVEQGFYIDVGAMDPERDSVSKSFYDRGWRGINIEPVRQWFEQLEIQRPNDINLQIVATSKKGEEILYVIPDTGLSTMSLEIAESHERSLGVKKNLQTVPADTLAEICVKCDVTDVHFLKIDVEGAERNVLKGMDFNKVRPWVVVVESTKPLTIVPTHEDWSHILSDAGYVHVYSDGLNVFYLAAERKMLQSSFEFPPNSLDNFVLSADHAWLMPFGQELKEANAQLEAVYESRSWKVTKPLRLLAELLRR